MSRTAASFRDRALTDKLVAFGEVGLSGEIRPVPNGEERLKEAATHGFLRAIVPRANAPKKAKMGEMEIVGVDRLSDALDALQEG
jgi:DNA repair protein RadA/Sms